MKNLPTASELRITFSDFAWFTFDLLGKVQSDRKYLKFAAVNSQIALELFLKYYYVTSGKSEQIQIVKNGQFHNDFLEFNQILNHFYATRRWSHGVKKEFVKLMEARNSIVHKGVANLNEEAAEIIVRTLLFIHATAWSDLGEVFFFDNYLPHPISKNPLWLAGVESFVSQIADLNNSNVTPCITCGAYSVVNGEILVLDEVHSHNDFVCLNCLTSVNIEHECRILVCYDCSEKAYYVDALNEQARQLYVGKCAECGTDTWVRKCFGCEIFYHPSSTDEVVIDGKYFCCSDCSQDYLDDVCQYSRDHE